MARQSRGRDPVAWAERTLAAEPSPTRGGQRLQARLQAEAREILANAKPEQSPWQPYYHTRAEYMAARKADREWAREHSQQPMSAWRPSLDAAGTKAYHDAYLLDWTWRAKGQSRGTPWHRYYVTQIIHEMTEQEYDDAYPGALD